jgi:hypothetical protein
MTSGYETGGRLTVLALLCCAAATAQAVSPGITSFRAEGTLPFDQIGLSQPPNVPSNIASAITSGALEIRQVVTWAPPGSNINVRHLLVQPGAPNPTPEGSQVGILDNYNVSVREVARSTNALTFIGTLSQILGQSPLGLSSGSPVYYSFGYTTPGTTTTFRNVTLVVPGQVTTYISSATGTLTFSGDGPGPTPGGLQANAGPDFSTGQSEVMLDAILSTIPPGSIVTYSWRSVSGPGNVLDPNSAQTRVQLAGNAGDYVFELTVTDDAGNTSSDQVRVSYTGRF